LPAGRGEVAFFRELSKISDCQGGGFKLDKDKVFLRQAHG